MLKAEAIENDLAIAHSDFDLGGLVLEGTSRELTGYFETEIDDGEVKVGDSYTATHKRILRSPDRLEVDDIVLDKIDGLRWQIVGVMETDKAYRYAITRVTGA